MDRYKDGPTGDEFPMAESLKLTIQRTLPYWNDEIVPDVSALPIDNLFGHRRIIRMEVLRILTLSEIRIRLQMKAGKRVLIAAHGNSLRGIVKHLDDMSDEAIMGLNLPTGIPFVYELDENLKPVVSMKVGLCQSGGEEIFFVKWRLVLGRGREPIFHPQSSKDFQYFQFLGDPETVKKAMEAVAAQGKAK